MNAPWRMTAQASGQLVIYLYDEIGDSGWGDGTTAKKFAEDLAAAGNVRGIQLRVNSPGGSVFDGITIYNTLLKHGAKITAQVDGLAASITSVIIMAAAEIAVCENAMMMIHNPHAFTGGDSNDLRKIAETMDKVKGSMILAYQRHARQLSAKQIGALMDAETWMTAEEAVEQGFAESVLEPDEVAAAARIDIGKCGKFKHAQQAIAAIAARPTPAPRFDQDDARRRQRDRIELLKRL